MIWNLDLSKELLGVLLGQKAANVQPVKVGGFRFTS